MSDIVACQELAVLQEELDMLVTRREDYEAVSGTRTAWEHARLYSDQSGSLSRCKKAEQKAATSSFICKTVPP